MGSAYITTRITSRGARFIVRYRLGGRSSRLLHAGSFSSYPEATRVRDELLTKIASGTRPETPERRELVYFARLGSLVKIGISVDPIRRCRDLNAELLASEPGGRDRERELHARFADHRESGEWFWPVPELLAYIENLQAELAATAASRERAERHERATA